MSATVRATAILDAKDQTGPAFASAQAKIRQLERSMARMSALENRAVRNSTMANAAIARQSSLVDRIGAGGALVAGRLGPGLLGAGAGLGVAAMAGQSVKRFAEVERAMTRVGITGEATNEEIASGIARMRQLAQETAQPFDRMREGMEALTSSGKSFQESLAMMPAIARTAQASGASMADTANSSIALLNHMGIKAEQIQLAQDIIAKGGKMGQFEAKDIAAAFPSILPAANAVGFNGIDGLKHLVSIAQTIRTGTGTSAEAATSLQNVLQKMEIEETAKKFKKFGVDLRKEMEDARKKGANLFDTFLDLTEKALKGDMSKLPQLFQDAEVLRGMRPLLTSRGKIGEFQRGLADAAGTTATDLARVLANRQADIDRIGAAWDRFTTAMGRQIAGMANKGDWLVNALETAATNSENQKPGPFEQQQRRLAAERDLRPLTSSIAREATIQADIIKLRDRIAADPKFAERHDVGARGRQYRDQLYAARAESGRRVQARLPAMGAGGNMYEVPGGLTVSSEAAETAREFKRFGTGPSMKPVYAPLPPIRPNGSEQFGESPALDFSAAVDSAKEAKIDIEAALTAIDLASAGAQAGAGFKNNLLNELKQAETESLSIAARIKAALSFTATPKLTPGGLSTGKSGAGNERPPISTMEGF